MTCTFMCAFILSSKYSFAPDLCQVCATTQGVFEMRPLLCGADNLPRTFLWLSNLTGTRNVASVYQKKNRESVEFYQCW